MNRTRADALLRRAGVEALVVTRPENVLYVTDYAREPPFVSARDSNWAIYSPTTPTIVTLGLHEFELPALVQDERDWMPHLVIPAGFETAMPDAQELESVEREIRALVLNTRGRRPEVPGHSVENTLQSLGLTGARIGFDDPAVQRRVSEAVVGTTGVDARDLLRQIRMVKTERELVLMADAARALDRATTEAFRQLRSGSTLIAATAAFRRVMLTQGGCGRQLVHGLQAYDTRADRVPPARGHVQIRALAERRHYWSASAHPLFLGDAEGSRTDQARRTAAIVTHIVDELRVGQRVPDLIRAGRAAWTTDESAAHIEITSIGLEPYESPRAVDDGTVPLAAGMTLLVSASHREPSGRPITVAAEFALEASGARPLNVFSLQAADELGAAFAAPPTEEERE